MSSQPVKSPTTPSRPAKTSAPRMRFRLGRLLIWLMILPIIFLVILWALLGHFQAPLLEQVSKQVGVPIAARQVDTYWHQLRPTLEIQDLVIGDKNLPELGAISIRKVYASIDLRSVFEGNLIFKNLHASQAKVDIVKLDQRYLSIGGMTIDQNKPSTNKGSELRWLLAQKQIVLTNVEVRYFDHTNPSTFKNQTYQPLGLWVRQGVLNTKNLTDHIWHLQARLTNGTTDFTRTIVQEETSTSTRGVSKPLNELVKKEQIVVNLRFNHKIFHDAANYQNWIGNGDVTLHAFPLSPAIQYASPQILTLFEQAPVGSMNLTQKLSFAHGQIQQAQGQVRLRNVAGQFKDRTPFTLTAVFIPYKYQRDINNHRVTIPTIGVATQQKPYPLQQLIHQLTMNVHEATSAVKSDQGDIPAGYYLNAAYEQLFFQPTLSFVSSLPVDKSLIQFLSVAKIQGSLQQTQLELTASPKLIEVSANQSPLVTKASKSSTKKTVAGVVDPSTTDKDRYQYDFKYKISSAFKGIEINPVTDALKAFPVKIKHPIGGYPGGKNLSGFVQADNQQVQFKINSQQGMLNFPGLLKTPDIPFKQLTASGQYLQKSGQHIVSFPVIHLQTPFIDVKAQGQYRLDPKIKNHGFLKIKGHAPQIQLTDVHKYLPLDLDSLGEYLAKSIHAGLGRNLMFNIDSPLKPFPPKTPKQGTFLIRADLQNGVYNAVPDEKGKVAWPYFEKIDGQMILDRNRLDFHISQAQTRSVKLHPVSVEFPDLSADDAWVNIQGKANGATASFLDYINHSPVNAMLNHFTEGIKARGNGSLDLGLKLPLSDAKHTKVAGEYHFMMNDVKLFETLPVISKMNGTLDFNESDLKALNINAQFLGGAAHIQKTQVEKGLAFEVKGHVTPQGLIDAYLHSSISEFASYFSGVIPYLAEIKIQDGLPTISVDSTLEGTGIHMPAPIAKTPEQIIPTSFMWQQYGYKPYKKIDPMTGAESKRYGNLEGLQLDYGNVLSANFFQARKDDEIDIISGGYGVNMPAPNTEGGVLANARLDSLNIDEWRRFIGQLNEKMERVQSNGTKQAQQKVVEPTPSANNSGSIAGNHFATENAEDTEDELETIIQRVTKEPEPPTTQKSTVENSIPNDKTQVTQLPVEQESHLQKVESVKHQQTSTAADYVPTAVALQAKQVRLLDRTINNVVVGASRTGDNWQANIDSDQINGFVSWEPGELTSRGTPGFAKIEGNFAKLRIPDDEKDSLLVGIVEKGLTENEYEIPGLNITADQFIIFGKDLGHFKLLAENELSGKNLTWRLNELELKNAWGDLDVQGRWSAQVQSSKNRIVDPNTSLTEVGFNLKVLDGGQMFDTFGLKDVFARGHGEASGEFNWKGSPINFATQNLNGKLMMDVQDGVFLKFDPGAIKLLSLFSIPGVLKMLSFDFRDLTDKGTPLNDMNLKAGVKQGVATIDEFNMSASLAEASMTGTVDLNQQSQDIQLSVSPQLDLTTASLAAFAINPAIGVGTLVSQWIFGKTLLKAIKLRYEITGTWQDPKIDGVSTKTKEEHSQSSQAPLTNSLSDPSVDHRPESLDQNKISQQKNAEPQSSTMTQGIGHDESRCFLFGEISYPRGFNP